MNALDDKTSKQAPIGIIAGNGRLPVDIAEMLQGQGRSVFVIAIEGEADSAIKAFPHVQWTWEQVGRLFRVLKENKVRQLVLAGGVIGRPVLKVRKMDWGTIRTLPGVLSMLLAGDNTILSGVISIFQKQGFEVCSIADLLPQLAVKRGHNTPLKPKNKDIERIVEGFHVSRALGQFDIGQACVVLGKRAVALEGVEGTDAMVRRIIALRDEGRLPQKKGGVLVKSMKPKQDERADLPAIGPDTITRVHEAQLLGIGVQADKALIVERDKTLRLAEELGIFIYGFDINDPRFQAYSP